MKQGDASMSEKEVRYVEYIKNRFPQLDMSNIRFNLSDGKYNDVVIINEESVFKFARYDWTAAFLANEVKVTDFLSEYSNKFICQVEYLDPGIAKCKFIYGSPLFRNEMLLLKDSDQNYIAKQIGSFLRQLHSIPAKSLISNHMGQISDDLSREAFLSEYDDIQRKVYPYCDSYTKECIKQIFSPIVQNEDFLKFDPTLIHADLTPHRFICDKETKRINAVIGFGSAGMGDPAYDVGALLNGFGETFVKRIGRYYGDMTKIIGRARFYANFNHWNWAKRTADMITTRDFSQFRFDLHAIDIMPIEGK